MLHEQSTATPFPSCFSFAADDPQMPVPRSGQSLTSSVYRAMVAGRKRHVTVTWCRDVMVNGLTVAVEESVNGDVEEANGGGGCKVEVRPWQFWRRQGAKRFRVDGEMVEVLWDLRAARFAATGGDPEPRSSYYVVLISDGEVALLLGDLREEALRKCGCRMIPADAAHLVSRTEHLFGKRRFSTRAKFHEKGQFHDISIECDTVAVGASPTEPEMAIRVDGEVAVHVKHLQWKFRGNQSICVRKDKVEVYWNVHDWLFVPGSSNAVFVFEATPPPPSSSEGGSGGGGGSPEFRLFIYAWKLG